MTPRTDNALIVALLAGQQDALAELYDRHAPLMFAVCKRMLGNVQEAQDLLHDLFLEVWQRAHEYDANRGSVRSWLLVRTRSRASDLRRSSRLAKRELAWPEHHPEHDGPAGLPEPDRLAVRSALATLPLDVRTVLELRYFAGMTAKETAVCIAAPEGTVRSRLARGISMLQRSLCDQGNEHALNEHALGDGKQDA